jgi:ankyrin repeat protein
VSEVKAMAICYESDLLELSPQDVELCYGPFEDIDKVDSYGDTLLLASCKNLNLSHVNYYLEQGANPDFRNDCGETPLLEVIDTAEDHEEASLMILKALIAAGANLEVRGYMDKTPFLKACSRNSLAVVKFLVASGCDTRAVISEHGKDLDGNWFADCFHLEKDLKEYFRSVVYS